MKYVLMALMTIVIAGCGKPQEASDGELPRTAGAQTQQAMDQMDQAK
ncbi:MAG: hypothetical protein HYZ74_04025 [Elusimicrobia bacterium]|nr:hypothetical protein [Elusimicrobiota bacterium]